MDERWAFVTNYLSSQREKDCLRVLRTLWPAEASSRVTLDGRSLLNLATNDYLGLHGDPRLAEAASQAASRCGMGSGGSRLICGTTPAHEEAEAALASFHGSEAALTFSSGYAAGVGVIAALAGRGDRLYLDRLCHASLYDGARLSGARLERFRHNDLGHLRGMLERDLGQSGRVLVVSDAVFSMDGDRAEVAALAALCREHGALFLLDEAHSMAVLGPGGRGLAAEADLPPEDVLVLGTLGKAFGLAGAYVVCTREVREYLVNTCRPFIYSTAPPAPLAAAVACSVAIAATLDDRRAYLAELSERFRQFLQGQGYGTLSSSTQIVPLVTRTPQAALDLSTALREHGVLAPAVRPPTVPQGTSRVRFSLSAVLSEEDFDLLCEAVKQAGGLS